MIGAIRRELLSGIREQSQLLRWRTALRAYDDVRVETADHEEAARIITVVAVVALRDPPPISHCAPWQNVDTGYFLRQTLTSSTMPAHSTSSCCRRTTLLS
jgi:hypothetical protein